MMLEEVDDITIDFWQHHRFGPSREIIYCCKDVTMSRGRWRLYRPYYINPPGCKSLDRDCRIKRLKMLMYEATMNLALIAFIGPLCNLE